MPLAVGQTLTHYEILAPLGAGGMGEVYRARDTRLEREVAIKVLPEEFADDEERLRRFEREAKTLASLQHANVAGIHGIDQVGDTCFLAMELVPGEDLAAKLARGPLPVDEAIDVCRQIAEGLEAAHEAGVVHRDLKPANVRVTPEGVVKVLDFGLAKAIEPSERREGTTSAEPDSLVVTEEGLVLGTPTYMSPEQARGRPVDRRTDVWAFGCVLYECLTGCRAFEGESLNDVLAAVAGDEPDASRLPAGTPASVRRLLQRCFVKDPERRLATLHDARTALEGKRLDRRLLAFGALGLALVLGLVYQLGRTSAPETAPNATARAVDPDVIAVMPFTVRGGSDLAYLGSGLMDLLSVKLDGAGSLRTVDTHAVLRQLTSSAEELDPESAAGVAAALGAGRFVLGSLVEAGGSVQLASSLYTAGGPSGDVSHGRAEGRVEDVFALVDEVAARLLVGLSVGPEAQVQSVAGVTTDSLAAFKAYLEGEDAYRQGEYGSALGHFERAVEIDPEFALAHYRISTAAEWVWDETRIYSAAERAVELADRLPERERQLVEVLGARRRETNEDAETVLRSFVGTYPNDLEAWANLGELVNHTRPMHGGSFLEAREIWNRVLGLDESHSGALLHRTRMDAYERRLEDMDAALERFHELYPDADRRIEMDVLTLATHGDPASVARAFEVLEEASDVDLLIGVWNAAVYARNHEFSIALCERMARPEGSAEVRRIGYAWLASLQYARGRIGAMRRALEGLAEVDALAAAEVRPLFLSLPLVDSDAESLAAAYDELEGQPLPEARGGAQLIFQLHDDLHPILRAFGLGRLALLLGRTDEVLARADELDGLHLAADHERLAQDLALALRGHLALAGDDPATALRSFEAMRMSAWHGQTLFSPFYARTAERLARAEALVVLGRDDEALRWFENLAQNSPFEVAYVPIALRRRAEVHARRGEYEQAIALYGELVGHWKDGDPEALAECDSASSRLQELGD